MNKSHEGGEELAEKEKELLNLVAMCCQIVSSCLIKL